MNNIDDAFETWRALAPDAAFPVKIVVEPADWLSEQYRPFEIRDANGAKLMECRWAAATPHGQAFYKLLVELLNAQAESRGLIDATSGASV